jgi:DeoR/GlpR family transcriptional regulator of sugar metabolism
MPIETIAGGGLVPFGRSAFAHIVRLDAIELLITDQLPEPGLRDALATAEV